MGFYNKYRPQQFKDIIGQEQVTSILINQAKKGNFHHSYLFYGQSGAGKTTCARILAMTVNCANRNGIAEPCGQCQSCRTTREGHNWDVIEIDGARFRGIDDARDMVFRAYLSPIGKYKVYIIDECQMLTEPAWNTLLKLLEEPPPHLIIILCTTTHFTKFPDTVVSRCMLLPFTPLTSRQIKEKLNQILSNERVNLDGERMTWIAETACGNLRKAENILEELCIARG